MYISDQEKRERDKKRKDKKRLKLKPEQVQIMRKIDNTLNATAWQAVEHV